MITEPRLEYREERPYVAIRTQFTMRKLAARVASPIWSELYAWLKQKNISPAGAPFIRYLVIDMAKGIEVEVGIPVGSACTGDAHVQAGILPAGRYATLVYTGRYKELVAATGALLAWAEGQGIVWQMGVAENTQEWNARIESYLSGSKSERAPEKWQTELAFQIAEDPAR